MNKMVTGTNKANLEFALSIIRKIRYMTIATVGSDGLPWNSPVARSFDDELNLYWVSNRNSEHSKNIHKNHNVFIVIYDSTVPSTKAWGST